MTRDVFRTNRNRRRHTKSLGMAGLFAVLCLLVGVPGAPAFVYYGDTNHYAIGRAGLDGEAPQDPFGYHSYQVLPCGVATDGRYLYWANKLDGTIGRERIDGTGPADPSFIVGADEPCGLAVYSGHLYWTNRGVNGSIGRANLSGARDVRENFVPSEQGSGRTDLQQPCGVAVDRSGIYWTTFVDAAVGRANLDGTGERTLITGGGAQGCGVALGSGFLFWGRNTYVGAASIGRALESGLAPEPDFITGLTDPCGLATFSHYLYFADRSTIDRTDLLSTTPTAATEQIVLGTSFACGVAVDSLFSGTLHIIGYRSLAQGAARLTVSVSGPGVVVVAPAPTAAPLLRTREAVRRAGRATVNLRPTATGRRLLQRHPRLRIKVRVSFTPTGGITTSQLAILMLHRG